MADQKVLEVQRWMNTTYFGNKNWVQVETDGETGIKTVAGLIRALQIELGLDVDGSFGPGTKSAFNSLYPNGLSKNIIADTQQQKNINVIVNGGLFCRGIAGDWNNLELFSDTTEEGIITMKTQLGLENPDGIVRAIDMKAILTTDAYTTIDNEYNIKVREIQQALNRKYLSMMGDYLATNGLYDRNTNKVIKMAVQYEIGVDIDGSWGDATKNALPALTIGSSNTDLIYLLQYLLFLNGFDPNGFDGSFGNGARNAVMQFQELMHLEVDGSVGPQTWFALAVSCGDTSRAANACDTCFEITEDRARLLKENGFEVVGRYLTGYISEEKPKALQFGEIETILNSGLKVFPIYQENNRQITDFSYAKGKKSGQRAREAAITNLIPDETVIYFAVDLDVYEDQIEDYIVEFFKGINEGIGNRYKVGIYGPRLVCQRVSEAGLAESSFVADMSSGYSCNIGQKMPQNWNYDQFKEITNFENELDIDKVTYRGEIEPISSLNKNISLSQENEEIINFLKEAYELAAAYHGNSATIKENNSLVIQYIAYKNYNSIEWNLLLEYDMNGINYINNNISKDRRDSPIYVGGYNKLITLSHLCASMYLVLNNRTGVASVDSIIVDLTGWAGDLIQFAGSYEEKYKNGDYPSLSEEFIEQILGDNTDAASNLGFDLEDLLQDIDVWMLYKSLNNIRIDMVFSSYYNDIIIGRGEGFINNREQYGNMPGDIQKSDSIYNKAYKVARSYLNIKITDLEGLAATAFEIVITEKPATMPVLLENVAKAFAKKISSMV